MRENVRTQEEDEGLWGREARLPLGAQESSKAQELLNTLLPCRDTTADGPLYVLKVEKYNDEGGEANTEVL